MNSLRIQAPAKLNLGLRITGVRDDGYHEIESIFSSLTLADELTVELQDPGEGISLKCFGITSPEDAGNLVWKAADLFRERTGMKQGISLKLHKNIPSPGGLGGGSSDTASTLKALAELTGFRGSLRAMAEELGSDVPFFLTGYSSAIVKGRGEIVSECRVPEFHAVLVNSDEKIPTPMAYRMWDEQGGHLTEPWYVNHYTALNFGVWHEGKPFPVELGNHFLPILQERFHGVKRAAGDLAEICDNWGLSGSGPVLYALFTSEEGAKEAEESLNGKYPWVFRCRSRQIGASSNG